MSKTKVAIIGSGNIGTDLMIKVMRLSKVLEMGAFVGIDAESDGLKRAQRMGVPTTAEGIDGLTRMPDFGEIQIVFDATSAGAHKKHDAILQSFNKRVIDLTPAAIGPFTILSPKRCLIETSNCMTGLDPWSSSHSAGSRNTFSLSSRFRFSAVRRMD